MHMKEQIHFSGEANENYINILLIIQKTMSQKYLMVI